MSETTLPTADRTYKSRIFAMVYRNKKDLLELYNAVSGRSYQNPELLEINTLENAIYMSMHNDVSFLIDSRLSLYEHQSTYNPNLPLRYLLYIADLFSAMTKDENLYGTKRVLLPSPKFVIFYNGLDEQPDRQILRLSASYAVQEEKHALELEAVMLNINKGHNKHLMDACKSLHDYAEYTARVRKYTETMKLDEAVEQAITECINEGILADFLKQNRAEAKNVSIYEYDMEKHMRMEKADSWEEGRKAGETTGRENLLKELISKKSEKGKSPLQIAAELEMEETIVSEILKELQNTPN